MKRTIFVKRTVLAAAQRLEALADSDKINPLDLAENKISDCQAAGDGAGIKFWRCVWTHLMIARENPVCFQVLEEKDLRTPAPNIGSRSVREKIGAELI